MILLLPTTPFVLLQTFYLLIERRQGWHILLTYRNIFATCLVFLNVLHRPKNYFHSLFYFFNNDCAKSKIHFSHLFLALSKSLVICNIYFLPFLGNQFSGS